MDMKSCLFVFALVLFSCTEKGSNKVAENFQQTAPEKKKAIDTLAGIQEIDQWVAAINASPLKDSVYLEDEDLVEGDEQPDGGISLTGYYQGKDLVKMHEWVGPSYGIVQRNYFFHDNRLVYAEETEDAFARNKEGDIISGKPFANHYVLRNYFRDSGIIHTSATGKRFMEQESIMANDWLDMVRDDKKALHEKRTGTK
jgi:hypothetical protein